VLVPITPVELSKFQIVADTVSDIKVNPVRGVLREASIYTVVPVVNESVEGM
jgi:hypothetical protein